MLTTLVGLLQTMKLLKFSIKHIVNNALESVAILHVHVIHQTIMASNKTKHENKEDISTMPIHCVQKKTPTHIFFHISMSDV